MEVVIFYYSVVITIIGAAGTLYKKKFVGTFTDNTSNASIKVELTQQKSLKSFFLVFLFLLVIPFLFFIIKDVFSTPSVQPPLIAAGISTKDKQKIDRKNNATETQQVHYRFGKSNELVNSGLLLKKKPFLGKSIFTLNPNYDQNFHLNTANKEVFSEFFLNSDPKKIKVITPHPSNSFVIKKHYRNENSKFIILDKELFWSNSNHLIVTY